MKNHRNPSARRGFTLMELMVAMAITSIIVTVLVSITSLALNTYNRSRSELRASRQAKSMIDTMARDFETLVTRKGNTNEWLSAISDSTTQGRNLTSTNATKLFFFCSPNDGYATTANKGGDISCVAYQLEYKDPIGTTPQSTFNTFVLNRLIINPAITFERVLGATSTTATLESVVSAVPGLSLTSPENFICENIFQFSVIFHVEVTRPGTGSSGSTVVNVPVGIGQANSSVTSQSFKIKGTGLETDVTGGAVTPAELQTGRVTAVEISATFLTDQGMERSRVQNFGTAALKSKFLAQNSFEYTKIVPIPSM